MREESNKTKGSKQDRQNQLGSPMSEGGEPQFYTNMAFEITNSIYAVLPDIDLNFLL